MEGHALDFRDDLPADVRRGRNAAGQSPCNREGGSLNSMDDCAAMSDKAAAARWHEALDRLHVHLYPDEWSDSGEVRHLHCDEWRDDPVDGVGGPSHKSFLDLVAQRRSTPRIIREAKDSQDKGAVMMRDYWLSQTAGEGVMRDQEAA